MAVFQLPTGVLHRSAAFAYRGGSFFDKRDFAATAVLVKHPRGDLLIDTGFGRQIDALFGTMPAGFRLITSYRHTRAAVDIMAGAGYNPASLHGIVLTHAHWDHVSGVPDFPGTPVWVTREERNFIAHGGKSAELARSLRGVRYREYGFDGGAYLGFAKSYDVYGDGAIVIVPAPGHTPGSVVIFLALPDGKRYALAGDMAWQNEGVSALEERAWPLRAMVDSDRQGVRESLRHMAAVLARFPALLLVLAHDQRGFAQMPRL
jgi:glyoxylase-like metal-dependent hydrolase (beta-lactamase superfamily II)